MLVPALVASAASIAVVLVGTWILVRPAAPPPALPATAPPAASPQEPPPAAPPEAKQEITLSVDLVVAYDLVKADAPKPAGAPARPKPKHDIDSDSPYKR
jgi:hypothetical protein